MSCDVEDEDAEDIFNCELFVDKSYQMKLISVADVDVQLYALHRAASTDHDLTGQIVWPAARLLSLYLVLNPDTCRSRSVLELGAGAGLAGLVAAKLSADPSRVTLTDNNLLVLELLQRNVDVNFSDETVKPHCCKLCWGDESLDEFSDKYGSYDLILGADVVFWPQAVPLLFQTVHQLLAKQPGARFILSYIDRSSYSTRLMFEHARDSNLCWTKQDLTDDLYQTELREHSLTVDTASILIFTLNT